MKKFRISRKTRKILYVCLLIVGVYGIIPVIFTSLSAMLSILLVIGLGGLKAALHFAILHLVPPLIFGFLFGFLIKTAVKNLSLIKKQSSKNP
ncbi:MAG: hypothetical protein KAX20_06075 [Candidatus Omnitrophica bacterium]|nr:hypothetical protein [Candidatus Omnitrophota bacterium]